MAAIHKIAEQDDAQKAFHAKADKIFLPVLWLLFIFTLGLSQLHDTLEIAIWIGFPLALLPTILIFTMRGTLASRLSVAIALILFCALNIHQAMGANELHFGIFVSLAFLLCYQDWRVIIAAALTAAVHHLSFNFLQEWDYGPICFTHPGLTIVIVHAAYVVVEAGVLTYLAVMMQKETRRSSESHFALQRMFATTNSAVDVVRNGIQEITSGLGEIAGGSANLSTRTESQASNLHETANSIEELSSSAKQNADSAMQTNALVLSASTAARKGADVVSRAVSTMGMIKESSNKVGDIISVINGIAFQTNILALNAAVEAARAGEEGRGFAVVATEVRGLAQRSASAAKEIETLISDSVEKINIGNKLVTEAGDSMQLIENSVEQVKNIIKDINVASQQQCAGIEQVSQMVAQLDEMTQQNAMLAEQTSSTADKMNNHAHQVTQAMVLLNQH